MTHSNYTDHNKNQAGYIIVVILIATGILSWVLTNLLYNTHITTTLMYITNRGEIRKISAINSVINKFQYQDINQLSNGYICLTDGTKNSETVIRRDLCIIHYTPDTLQRLPSIVNGATMQDQYDFPRINFEKLLLTTSTCQELYNFNSELTPAGRAITQGSSVGETTCRDQKLLSEASIELRSNYSITTSVVGASLLSSITTAGFLEFNAPLLVNSDLRIISGGDIYIKEIENSSTETRKLTLISTTGTVVIENIIGRFEVTVFGWAGYNLPKGVVFGPPPSDLPIQQIQIISIL